MMSFIRDKLMLYKQYMTRSNTYLGIINSGMLLFLCLSKLKEKGVIGWDIDKYSIIIFLIGIISLIFLGWFEIRVLKGLQKEAEIGFNFCPPYVEMREKINKIYEHMKL